MPRAAIPLLLLMSLALGAAQSWAVSPPVDGPQEDWGNRVYPRAVCAMEETRRGLPLANGRYAAAAMDVSLEHVAHGDSNANGVTEALVFVKCRRGPRFWHSTLVYEVAPGAAGPTLIGAVIRTEPITKVEVLPGALRIGGAGGAELYRWSAGVLLTDEQIAARAAGLAEGDTDVTDREVLLTEPAAQPAPVPVPTRAPDEPAPIPPIRSAEPATRDWEPAVQEAAPSQPAFAPAPHAPDAPSTARLEALDDGAPDAVEATEPAPPLAPVAPSAPAPGTSPAPTPDASPAPELPLAAPPAPVPAPPPPPEPPAPAGPPVASGLVKWLSTEGALPPGAVPLYRGEAICAVTEGGFELGVHREGLCELGSGTVEAAFVLMGSGRWLPSREAIAEVLGLRGEAFVEVGGAPGELEQVCRVVRQGQFRVGLVDADGCRHTIDGESRSARTYDVLVGPTSPGS